MEYPDYEPGFDVEEDYFILYSVLYSTITLVFAMAVLTKFLTHEFRFGFRSFLSLVILFVGEPLCHFLLKGASGLCLFGLGCLFIYSILPPNHLPVENKAVLITGCDSGFGHALVKKLDSIGMRVYAGCLIHDGPGAIELKHTCSERLKILQLDVTKMEEITEVASFINQDVGSEGLWGLVNNAGIWYPVELEMTPEKILQKILDVNLFGAFRMTKSVLPLIRHAKGRVVNISSITGRIPLEANGAYAMSKHAMVAFSETLRLEMKKFGVHVSIVEPTGFRTGNTQEQNLLNRLDEVWTNLDEATKLTYGRPYIESLYTNIINIAQRKLPTDLTPVIRAIRSALLSRRPRDRYPCGVGSQMALTLYPLLPLWFADRFSQKISLIPRTVKPASLM